MRPVGFQRADPLRIWAVSDGKPGHANQALGLAEAVARRTGGAITVKTAALRTPWRWLPPGFIPAPRQALALASDPFEPPWPALWIGCGRAAAALTLGARGFAHGALTVMLQDPQVNPREFDLVAAPAHDGLEGPNVIATLGAPNRITPERLAESLGAFPALAAAPSPRLAVLIGGKSKRQDFTAARAADTAKALAQFARTGASLFVTLSRRTSPAARAALEAALKPHAALWYDGEGPNPYLALLAAAEAVVVTADSVSMAAEAATTGKPVHVIPVEGPAGKLARFHQDLQRIGAARPFRLPLATWAYEPLREADRLADVITAKLMKRMDRPS